METSSTTIVEYSKTEQALSDLRHRYTDAKYEVNTADGLKQAKSGRAEIRGYRINLEKMRKDIKAPALARCRLIDAEASRITDELIYLEAPIDSQIKEEEGRQEKDREEKIRAELKRVEDIQDRLAELRGAVSAVNSMGLPTPEKVTEFIADLEKIIVDGSFDEFEQQAHDAKASSLALLRENLAAANEREAENKRIAAERKELAKLRAGQEKRDAEERAKREAEAKKERQAFEAKQKEQADAQAKIDAEEKRIADERAQLEHDKEEEERKKEDERKKVAAAMQAEAEAERKRRDKAQAAARKAKYPGEPAIVAALAEHFGVDQEVVKAWIVKLRSKS